MIIKLVFTIKFIKLILILKLRKLNYKLILIIKLKITII
jgi:hypothetical protein